MYFKDWVAKCGRTKVKISEDLGISKQTVYDLIWGRSIPSMKLATKIFQYTDGEVDYESYEVMRKKYVKKRETKE